MSKHIWQLRIIAARYARTGVSCGQEVVGEIRFSNVVRDVLIAGIITDAKAKEIAAKLGE